VIGQAPDVARRCGILRAVVGGGVTAGDEFSAIIISPIREPVVPFRGRRADSFLDSQRRCDRAWPGMGCGT